MTAPSFSHEHCLRCKYGATLTPPNDIYNWNPNLCRIERVAHTNVSGYFDARTCISTINIRNCIPVVNMPHTDEQNKQIHKRVCSTAGTWRTNMVFWCTHTYSRCTHCFLQHGFLLAAASHFYYCCRISLRTSRANDLRASSTSVLLLMFHTSQCGGDDVY